MTTSSNDLVPAPENTTTAEPTAPAPEQTKPTNIKGPFTIAVGIAAFAGVYLSARALAPTPSPNFKLITLITSAFVFLLIIAMNGTLDRVLLIPPRGQRVPSWAKNARNLVTRRADETPGTHVTPRPLDDDEHHDNDTQQSSYLEPSDDLPIEFRHIIYTARDLTVEQLDGLDVEFEKAEKSRLFVAAVDQVIEIAQQHPLWLTEDQDPHGRDDNPALFMAELENSHAFAAAVAGAYALSLGDPDADQLALVLKPWFEIGGTFRRGNTIHHPDGTTTEARPENVEDMPSLDSAFEMFKTGGTAAANRD